jgi:hypothetical protein
VGAAVTAVTATTSLTEAQVAGVFETMLGFPPRAADLAVLRVLSPSGPTPVELTLYIWDHILGEPDEPTFEQVALAVWDCLNEDERQWRA